MRHIVLILCLLALYGCQPNALETNAAGAAAGDGTEAEVAQPDSVGEGTAVAPYTVAQVQQGVSRTADVWVAGYVVGYCDGTINKCNFTAHGAVLTNVLLAATPTAYDKEEVLTVQLSGKTVQRDLALCYDPSRLGRAVMLHVEVITKYLSALGLYGVDQYLWLDSPEALDLAYAGGGSSGGGGGTGEDDPDTPTTDAVEFHKGVGEDVFSIDGILYDDVTKLNPTQNFTDMNPCEPWFILSKRYGAWQTNVWVIGYVKGWNNGEDDVKVVSLTDGEKALYADIEIHKDLTTSKVTTDSMKTWMRESLRRGKNSRPIRIHGALKDVKSDCHIVKIDYMDWLTPKE